MNASVLLCVLAISLIAPHARAGVVFDENISLQYLHYAFAAFCPADQLLAWNCQWCSATNFTVVDTVYDAITEAYGFVGYNTVNSTIVISFRGSSNVPNWIDDFDFYMMDFPPIPGAKIHQGFYFAWLRMQKQVYSLMNSILDTHCPHCVHVVTTGHSLGAALAGVSAIEIAMTFPNVTITMNNFGMPRIGNPDFADAFDHLVPTAQRMVHQHDIVPHIPMIDLGYHHPAYEIWDLSNDTAIGQRYVVCNSSGEDPNCSDSVPAYEWDPNDHNIYMGIHNDNCGQ